jgi:RNA polymerase-binding transcription factor DksA
MAVAKKTAKKAPVKAAPGRKPAAKPVKPVAKKAAQKTTKKVLAAKPAKKVAAKAAPAKASAKKAAPAKKVAAKATPRRRPVVREDESPWTAAELRAVRAELEAEVVRLEEEIVTAEAGLADLIRDSGDGAGDDQADAGSKTFEREHEMSLANNARDMLMQAHHALGRIDDGTYGMCESCAKPIGKYRLQAFPRATLCLVCKQQEERS